MNPAALGACEFISYRGYSGYAEAARRYILALVGAGCDVTWTPLTDPLLRPRQSVDTVVAATTPEYFPSVRDRYPSAMLVGQTVWETDCVPRHWRSLLEVPDLLMVPCAWNAEVFRSDGVATPIAVVPHIAPHVLRPRANRDALGRETFVFYTIGEWTTRKAVWNTIRAYIRAFTSADPVLLVVKTSRVDRTERMPSQSGPLVRRGTTPWAVARLLGEVTDPAPIRLIVSDLSEIEIAAIHTRGDCFVLLSRSEGWCIPAFDAAAYGNPIVMTGFGGQLDYLDPDLAYLVDFELTPVDDPIGVPSYTPDQMWAEPSVEHGAELLRRVFTDRKAAGAGAQRLARRVQQRYRPGRIAAKYTTAVAAHRPETASIDPSHAL